MKLTNKTVLISGGSIAGPATAFWLARNGFKVTLVERAPSLRQGGNGVDVRGHAIEVVKRMGLWFQVRAKAADINGMLFLNSKGQSISRVNMKSLKQKLGSKEVEILRGDLAVILYEATKHNVEYIFGDGITALNQDINGVEVMFEKASPRRFDLVIGADGIHSQARKLIFGAESQFLAYKNHYFAFTTAEPELGEKGWMSLYNEPGRVAGLYRANNQTEAKAYFAFYRAEPLMYDYRNLDEQKRLLADGLKGMGWITTRLLEGALADPNLYFDSLSQVKMLTWSKGRIVLVGDAAYCASPLTGAGAALSLIGAYRLAGELITADGNYATGFKKYELGFRPTIERQQAELFTAMVVPNKRLSLWVRNMLTKLPIMGPVASMERRLQVRKNEQLPDYIRLSKSDA